MLYYQLYGRNQTFKQKSASDRKIQGDWSLRQDQVMRNLWCNTDKKGDNMESYLTPSDMDIVIMADHKQWYIYLMF